MRFFESCAMRAKRLTFERQGWLQMQVSLLMYTAEHSAPAPTMYANQHQTFASPTQSPSFPAQPSNTFMETSSPPTHQAHELPFHKH